MNNLDLINQMNSMTQNLVNESVLYMNENSCTRVISNIEAFIFISFTGLLVLFTIFTIWYSFKN